MNHLNRSKTWWLSQSMIYLITAFVTVSCVVPIINLLAISFSSSQPIIENKVSLLPVGFTTKAYSYVMQNQKFWTSAKVSALRVLIGLPLNLVMTVLVAYPLSKSEQAFTARKYYVT